MIPRNQTSEILRFAAVEARIDHLRHRMRCCHCCTGLCASPSAPHDWTERAGWLRCRWERLMEPQLVVNGQSRALGDVGGHVTLLDWLRADGLTGSKEGLRGGRVWCLRRAGRPAGRRRPQPMDRDQCLSGPGRRLRRPGGAHRRGSRAAPAALHPVQQEMAVPRRFAVRVLHAGLHLRDGRGVLPTRSTPDRPGGAGRRGRARGRLAMRPQRSRAATDTPIPPPPVTPRITSTVPTASTCTR